MKNKTDRDIKFNVAVVAAILSFVIGVTMGAVAIVTATRVERNSNRIAIVEKRDNQRLTIQAFKACRRLKIERAKSNSNSRILYILSKQIQASSLATNRKLKATGIYSRKEYKARILIAQQYGDLASQIQWTPQTNCKKAILGSETYKNPKPRHFHFKVKIPEIR